MSIKYEVEGAIQIIRDILCGVDTVWHRFNIQFETLFLVVLKVKSFVW
jgi:hypothetical protein